MISARFASFAEEIESTAFASRAMDAPEAIRMTSGSGLRPGGERIGRSFRPLDFCR